MSFKLFLICAFVLLGRPQDILAFLQPVRPALLFTVLAMLALALGDRRSQLAAALKTTESKRYLFFYGIMIVGIPFADHKGLAFGGVFQAYLVNMLFFFLVVAHVTSLQALKTLVWTVCLCALMYAFFGGILRGGGGGRFQSAGGFLDPNDTAFVLLSLFPLCLYFVSFNEGLLKKMIAIATVVCAIAVILQTGSRGGILGIGVVLPILLLTRFGDIRLSHKLLFVVLFVSTAVLMRDKIDIERYLTLTEISSDYNVSAEGGRLELWKAALDIALRNPITGVGVECYPFARFFAREQAGESYLRWQPTHNSLLQIAAEVGLIGFAVFTLMILRSLSTFVRKGRMSSGGESKESIELRALSGLMLVGFSGLLVSGFFLSQGYSIFFTLYFAFAAVIVRLQPELILEQSPQLQDKYGDVRGNSHVWATAARASVIITHR